MCLLCACARVIMHASVQSVKCMHMCSNVNPGLGDVHDDFECVCVAV